MFEIRIGVGFLIVLIIVVIWIWIFQLRSTDYERIWLDDLLKTRKFKTGDIILFKAQDNWNGPMIACYFGHIGVVYVDPDKPYRPMLFEAAATRGMNLLPHQNDKGIFYEPLVERLQKYKGRTFYKELNKNVPDDIARTFGEFITYAQKNMYYEYNVAWSSIKKGLGIEQCNYGTNCGEITMLSLIRLGILIPDEYDRIRPHHLRDMCYFQKAAYEYQYYEPLEIKIDPFT